MDLETSFILEIVFDHSRPIPSDPAHSRPFSLIFAHSHPFLPIYGNSHIFALIFQYGGTVVIRTYSVCQMMFLWNGL